MRAHLGAYTGYHELVNQLFKHFSVAGIYCAMRPIAVDEQWGKVAALPAAMRSQLVNCRQPEEWELLVSPPDQVPTPGRKTIWFTMYESTQMQPTYVSLLNRAEAIVVPCQWNKTCFAANGVRVPIHVVPLGFDPDVYQPSPLNDEHGPLVFGVAGRTRHCAKRKGVQEAVDLFLKAFAGIEDVRLHVKLHADDTLAPSTDHRIKIFRGHMEPYEIAHWLRGISGYLTLSRAEGYGLWALQALASGRPAIACHYSGHADFLSDENSFRIPHREVEAISGESNTPYQGDWAEPNTRAALDILQLIYRRRVMIAEKANAAAASVSNLTWQNCASNLLSVLNSSGAIQ